MFGGSKFRRLLPFLLAKYPLPNSYCQWKDCLVNDAYTCLLQRTPNGSYSDVENTMVLCFVIPTNAPASMICGAVWWLMFIDGVLMRPHHRALFVVWMCERTKLVMPRADLCEFQIGDASRRPARIRAIEASRRDAQEVEVGGVTHRRPRDTYFRTSHTYFTRYVCTTHRQKRPLVTMQPAQKRAIPKMDLDPLRNQSSSLCHSFVKTSLQSATFGILPLSKS